MMLKATVSVLIVGVVTVMAYPGLYLPPTTVLLAPKIPIIRHQLVPIGTIVKTYPTIVTSSRQLLFQQRFGRKLNCNTTDTTTSTTTTTTTITPPTEAAMDAVLQPTTMPVTSEEPPTTTSTFEEETTDIPETTTTFPYTDAVEEEKIEENDETTTTTPNEVEEVTDLPEVTTELPQLKLLEFDLPLEVNNRIADEVEMTTVSQIEWDEKDNEIDSIIEGNDNIEELVDRLEDTENVVEKEVEIDNMEVDNKLPQELEVEEMQPQEVEVDHKQPQEVEVEEMQPQEVKVDHKQPQEVVVEEMQPENVEQPVTEVNNATEDIETMKESVLQEPSTTIRSDTIKPDDEEGSGSGDEGKTEDKNIASEVNEMAETEQKAPNYAQFDLPENLLNSYSSAFFHRFANSPFVSVQQHPIQIPVSIKAAVPSSPSNGVPLIKSYRPLLQTAAYTAALHPLPVFKKTTTTTTVEQHHHPQHFIHTHDGVALNYAPAGW